MNKKMEDLIHTLEKVHNKIIKIYKNIEAIKGQYRPRLKTIAKVLRLQTEHKIQVYNMMLMNASKLEVDITDEGYVEVMEHLMACEDAIGHATTAYEENIVETAEVFAKTKIELFESVLGIIEKYEVEKDIKHPAMKAKVQGILDLEKKDFATLESFHSYGQLAEEEVGGPEDESQEETRDEALVSEEIREED